MFERDYVMRLIKEMIRTILKLLLNIDTESPSSELLKDQEVKNTLQRLTDRIDAGNINEAENELYDITEDNNSQNLELALLFYSYLNDQSSDFLEKHDFSRDEVKQGIQRLASKYGISNMIEVLMID